MDYTVHGILQARISEWVAFPFSSESSQPWDRTQVSHIAGGFFTSWATREVLWILPDGGLKLICFLPLGWALEDWVSDSWHAAEVTSKVSFLMMKDLPFPNSWRSVRIG